MTLYQYNQLDELEQMEKLWNDGVFLDYRIDLPFKYALYQIHSFYIELIYHSEYNVLQGRKVDAVMQRARIEGIKACPKGLRHGFVITCLEKQIPLNMAQKWAGHSSLTTTAIYAIALGPEERSIASRLWG